ncbi:MAG TPA: MFS transporter [Nitrososphaerales archaeon]|nr:MFS transporter [Nitrososphaerales archaeon]
MQYKWTALTVTTVGTLMVGIDARILVIGLPTVAKQLHTGAAEVIWISQAFILATSVCLLLVGRIADLFGRVRLYALGFTVFTIGSALCAIAFDSYQLIAFRVLQGVGAAMIVANSVAIITDASPRNELGMLLSINQTAFRVGNVAGLTVSGLILSVVDWRGLFYVNIPIGIFGTLWAHRRLKEISTKDTSKKMDWLGFGLFSSSLALILLAITFLSYGVGALLYGYALLIAGFALLALFVWVEARSRIPLMDLHLFRKRSFAVGNFTQLINSIAWAGFLLLIAFYLQIGLGYSPFQAGISVVPLEIVYMVSSIVCGRLSDRYGSRLLTTLGLSIVTTGFVIVSTFGSSTTYYEIVLVLIFIGVGNGMYTSPNTRSIMTSVPPHRRGVAAGFRETMFNTGVATSYGLVILFITFGIPYGLFSPLLDGSIAPPLIETAKSQFYNGFRIATLVLGAIDAIAIVPSALRETREKQSVEELKKRGEN